MKKLYASLLVSLFLTGLLQTQPSFALTPILGHHNRIKASQKEIGKAILKASLSPIFGGASMLKHAGRDFVKGWQMARTGVIQSKLGDTLAQGRVYHQKTGFRRALTASAYIARAMIRLIPNAANFTIHAGNSGRRNLQAASDIAALGYTERQLKLERRANALKNFVRKDSEKNGHHIYSQVPLVYQPNHPSKPHHSVVLKELLTEDTDIFYDARDSFDARDSSSQATSPSDKSLLLAKRSPLSAISNRR